MNIIDHVDFSSQPRLEDNYENCLFKNCNFNGVDLSGIMFSECRFHSSDLSLVKTSETIFRGVQFEHCKLLGIHFETVNQMMFIAGFESCLMQHSSFFRMNLKKTRFINCNLSEADMSESDLSLAIFDNSDLSAVQFDNCNLEKADFRTAIHYSIDPERNRMKGARFSSQGLSGLLQKYRIEID